MYKIILLTLLLSGCSYFEKEKKVPVNEQPQTKAAQQITVEMQDNKGQTVGQVVLTEDDEGAVITTHLHGLPPGEKGTHIHEVGKCEQPSFESAGAHFNPTNKKHGIENEEGPHAGDLPNLLVEQDGTVEVEFIATAVRLSKDSLLDQDGSAMIIHEKPDDYKTDPAGNAGARIACGVIK